MQLQKSQVNFLRKINEFVFFLTLQSASPRWEPEIATLCEAGQQYHPQHLSEDGRWTTDLSIKTPATACLRDKMDLLEHCKKVSWTMLLNSVYKLNGRILKRFATIWALIRHAKRCGAFDWLLPTLTNWEKWWVKRDFIISKRHSPLLGRHARALIVLHRLMFALEVNESWIVLKRFQHCLNRLIEMRRKASPSYPTILLMVAIFYAMSAIFLPFDLQTDKSVGFFVSFVDPAFWQKIDPIYFICDLSTWTEKNPAKMV